jgi:hypothetical protein
MKNMQQQRKMQMSGSFTLKSQDGKTYFNGKEIPPEVVPLIVKNADKITRCTVQRDGSKMDTSHYTEQDAKAFDDTLTPKEKAAPTYLEWSNETLGRMVKETAKMFDDVNGDTSATVSGVCTLIASKSAESNASQVTIELTGVTAAEKPLGDWMIVALRLDDADLRNDAIAYLNKLGKKIKSKT